MNDSDIDKVGAAIVYAWNHPETFENTTAEEDREIEKAQVIAFIAGCEYAKNNPKSPS